MMFLFVVAVLLLIIYFKGPIENYYTVPSVQWNQSPQLDEGNRIKNPNIGNRVYDAFKYHSPSEWPFSSRDKSWDIVVPGLGKNRGIPTFLS